MRGLRMNWAHGLTVLIAALWGSGFVAQRAGLEHLGPFSFNAARLGIAAVTLIGIWLIIQKPEEEPKTAKEKRFFWLASFAAGTVLFAGFSFQQAGLQYTTAGNAGFITSMYIVIVPLITLFMGERTRPQTWIGIALAVYGLYHLSLTEQGFRLNRGDSLELIGAFFWAAHVVVLGVLARQTTDVVGVSVVQFVVATIWSVIAMWFVEGDQLTLQAFNLSMPALIYSGLIVSALGFTLQIVAQRHVSSPVAALIFSLEAVFAVIFGILFLQEILTPTIAIGCACILVGMVISQWPEGGFNEVD